MDLAASIQKVCEEVVLRSVRHAWERTGRPRNLVLAGGVALNCVANGRVLSEGPFENLWIQPAAGDAGGALGAALFTWHQILGQPRRPSSEDSQQASWLGPRFSREEVTRTLEQVGARYRCFEDEATLLDHVADDLSAGKIVGWFHGRSEFGPRALGARSILGDPRSADMQTDLNLKIKFREGFRPFAPCVLREHAHAWFEVRPGEDSPYMLLVAPVREEHRVALSDDDREALHHDPDLAQRVRIARSTLPAITHVDNSARLQTVDARHGRFRRLLEAFHARTGCPVLVNTSFNLSWEPIVQTPREAYETFMQSSMDTLVLEDCILRKEDQPLGLVPGVLGSSLDNGDGEPRSSEFESGEFPTLRDLLESMRSDPLVRWLGEQIPYHARVLEAGCGRGYLTNFLAVAHRSVLGVDDDRSALSTARDFQRIHRLHRSAFVRTNPTDPALPPGSFDVVLVTGAIARAPYPPGHLKPLVQLLRPGGHLVILAVEPWSWTLAALASRLGIRVRADGVPGHGIPGHEWLGQVELDVLTQILTLQGLEDLRVFHRTQPDDGPGKLFEPGAGEPAVSRGRLGQLLRTVPDGGTYLVVGRRPRGGPATP